MRLPARRITAAALLALPLVAGAAYGAVSGTDIASSWSAGADTSAPVAATSDSSLVDARRAAGEAGTQAGFLKQGTTELVDGAGKLSDGAKQLADGTKSAVDGASQLSDGMTQLQAGTGQLGAGATQVADGVGQAVDQVVGLEAVRGQILGAIDRVLGDLKDTTDPDAVSFRDQLQGLRGQVDSFKLDENFTNQLTQLRDGSREIANQLNTPGYGFHDGIYSATKGAKDLSAGLNQLNEGVDSALSGVDQLDQGAQKLDGMADNNKDKVASVSRALPIAQAGTAAAQEEGITRTLAPMYAFLIAAGVLLVAVFGSRRSVANTLLAGVVLSVLAGGLVAMLGAGMTATVAIAAAGIAGLLFAASALSAAALQRTAGPKATPVLLAVGALAQIGVVGWVWNKAATAQVSTAWQVVSELMPVHYSTAAISAFANGGHPEVVWMSTAVLAALTLAAAVAYKLVDAKVAPAKIEVDA